MPCRGTRIVGVLGLFAVVGTWRVVNCSPSISCGSQTIAFHARQLRGAFNIAARNRFTESVAWPSGSLAFIHENNSRRSVASLTIDWIMAMRDPVTDSIALRLGVHGGRGR